MDAAEAVSISAKTREILSESDKYQKDLLRRLGVRTNLEDREEFLVQLWAAARHAGFSDEEFQALTPRELCAVLEHRARELQPREQAAGDPAPDDKPSSTAKPVRRSPKYKAIDDALREIGKARPKGHKEVFDSLDKRVKVPNAEPFASASGWSAGFSKNPTAARAWLSKAWARLNLPPFSRGPK